MMTEDAIKCPHCNFVDTEYYDYVDPVEMEAEFDLPCSSCGEYMHVVMSTTVLFETTALDEEPEE